MVDNAELSADCYTATEGSIIITLKPEYLSTLAAGTHSISIVSANGVATADFEVQTADTTAVSPKTGDNDQAVSGKISISQLLIQLLSRLLLSVTTMLLHPYDKTKT